MNPSWDKGWDYPQYLECVEEVYLVPEADFDKTLSPQQLAEARTYIVKIPRAFRQYVNKRQRVK